MGVHGGEQGQEFSLLVRVVTDLVRYYREYYREQTPAAFDSLFRCMLDYDFSSYHEDMRMVHAMWREAKCVGDVATLKSGGSSTGMRRKYEFGPNFFLARLLVEGFLRLNHRKTLLVAVARGPVRPALTEDSNTPQYDFQIIGNWSEVDHVGFLFDSIRSISDKFGPVNLCALPCVWLGLTCNPDFCYLSSENSAKINAFVNTDSTPCFRRPSCRVRDQMVDWGSGVNFYTCESGKRHFLPMFFAPSSDRACNLLNLKRSSRNCDDLVGLGQQSEDCSCGQPRINMDFIPHRKNFPRDANGSFLDFGSLFDDAPDHTDWLQLYQTDGGENSLFYSCFKGDPNLDDLLLYLRGAGLGKTEVVRSRYFSVGNKKPIFWRSGNPIFFDRG